jgi:hypothetical protein
MFLESLDGLLVAFFTDAPVRRTMDCRTVDELDRTSNQIEHWLYAYRLRGIPAAAHIDGEAVPTPMQHRQRKQIALAQR